MFRLPSVAKLVSVPTLVKLELKILGPSVSGLNTETPPII